MKVGTQAIVTAALCVILSATLPLFSQTSAVAAAGQPVLLSPVEPGVSAFFGYGLPQFLAESATVTGPFLIAAQTTYAYGTIEGIRFATTASTNGQCDPKVQYDCSSTLLVEQLPSATVGLRSGTVTLSDGTSFEVIGNVIPPGVLVDPRYLGPSTLPGNGSDPVRLSLTNATSEALTIGKPVFIDENGSGATSAFTFDGGCGESLAAGATCTIGISFLPIADVFVEGFIQVPTGAGPVEVPFYASPDAFPPPIVKIDPQHLDLYVGSDGKSAVRTITITTLTTQGPEYTSIVGAGAPCNPVAQGSCLNIVSNDCAKIPLHGSCEIKAQFLVNPSLSFSDSIQGYLDLSIEPSTGDDQSFQLDYLAYPTPGPPSAAVIAVSPTKFQFPAVTFGQATAPKTLTVTNVSSRTLTVAVPSIPDFITDSSCVQLLPEASCEVLVRYVPTSGSPNTDSLLTVTATDVADPSGLTSLQAQQIVAATGSSISQAAVASPDAGVAPITVNSSVSLNVTNTSDVPLVFGAIFGNRDYYAGEAVIVDTTGCGASLAPGKSCALVVNGHDCLSNDGNPADGPCFLTIESNAWSSPDVYPLVGNETTDSHSVLTVDPSPFVFGHTPTGSASASQVIHVTLTNTTSSVNETFNVLPILDPDFRVVNQCPKVLVPQAVAAGGYATSCQILVTFAPQSEGFHVGTLTYRSSLKGDSLVLAGTGTAPAISVTPTSLNFPVTAVGSSSDARTLTFTNPGNSAITITAIALSGGQADDYVLAKTCGGPLAAGASCTVAVTFKPVSAGTKLASISIADSAGASSQSVALSGVGSAAPVVKLSTASLTFAKQAAGTSSASQTVTLTNSGSGDLTLGSITVTGGQADDYSLTKTCGVSLQPGANCNLSITFSPVSPGTKLASIIIVDNASNSPQSISLMGTGTAINSLPSVKLSVSMLTFAGQAPGTSSVAQTVNLHNSGATTLAFGSITVIGGQADDYLLATTCGASLPVGANCSLSVTFKPVSAGTKHASISIKDDADGSPPTITLIGVGT